MIRQRKHRLPKENYIGTISVSFTICIQNRIQHFISDEIFFAVEQILFQSLNLHRCDAHIYLFMPDHCHILMQGRNEKSNLWKCIVDFKQGSGFWFSSNGFKAKWQRSFYDHIMRSNEDIMKHTIYIGRNSIRKGIAEDWRKYPYMGSTIYDFAEW